MKKVKYSLEKDIRSKKILSSLFFGILILIGLYFSYISEDIADEDNDKHKIYKKNIISNGKLFINNNGEYLKFKEIIVRNDTNFAKIFDISGKIISKKDNKSYILTTNYGELDRNNNVLVFKDKVFMKQLNGKNKFEINSLLIDRNKKIFKGVNGFSIIENDKKITGDGFVVDDVMNTKNLTGNIKIIYNK